MRKIILELSVEDEKEAKEFYNIKSEEDWDYMIDDIVTQYNADQNAIGSGLKIIAYRKSKSDTERIEEFEKLIRRIEASEFIYADGEVEINISDEITVNEYSEGHGASYLRGHLAFRDSLSSDMVEEIRKMCDRNSWYLVG